MNIVSKYLVQPVKKFFERRKVHYLGFTQYRCQYTSVIFRSQWDQTEVVHFYASANGKKKIKGANADDIVRISAVVSQWFNDPDIDPFSLIPEYPSEFSKSIVAPKASAKLRAVA